MDQPASEITLKEDDDSILKRSVHMPNYISISQKALFLDLHSHSSKEPLPNNVIGLHET